MKEEGKFMNTIDTIQELIEETGLLRSKHPTRQAYQTLGEMLKELKVELSKTHAEPAKIMELRYQLMRTFQDALELENSAFGKDMKALIVQLREYDRLAG